MMIQPITRKRKASRDIYNRQSRGFGLIPLTGPRMASGAFVRNANYPRVVPGYTRTVGAYGRANPRGPLLEKKFLDTSIVNGSDCSAGTVLNTLNAVPQGTTDQTRIGNKITIKNINLHGFASMDDMTTGVFQDGILRVILYIDKQANGATAAVTDILKTAALASFRNMDQVDRFTILKDKTFLVPVRCTNALHTNQGYRPWKMNLKCNIPVHFSSTTGAITEIRSNNIGLLYITDSAVTNPAFVGTARIKFLDD